LTQLDANVPLEKSPVDLARQEIDYEKVRELFDLLEFRSLKERLPKVEIGALGSNLDKDQPEMFIQNGSLNDLDEKSLTAIYPADDLSECGIAQGSLAFVIGRVEFAQWATTSKTPKIFFDGKALLRAIAKPVPVVVGDLALMAYLLNPGARTPEISDVRHRYLQKSAPANSNASSLELDFTGGSSSSSALAEYAQDLLALYPLLLAECGGAGLTKVLDEIETPTLSLLARMEAMGIAIATSEAAMLEAYFQKRG
jgi:DNA polymerase-1